MNQPTDPAPTSPRQPVSAEQLEQKILELTKDRDDWKHEWEIYKGAWLRELGGYFRNKHHLIDALVVSTRELRERANTVALERDELFAKNKKLLEAYRSASLPVTPEPLHDLLDEVYGAFHPFLSVTGEMSSEDQWPKEHMVEFTICWEHILRAFHAWENLGDYLSEAASLPVQQAQPPRLQKAVPYDPLRRISHALSDQEAGASEQLAHIQQIVDEHYQKSAGRTDNA